MELYLQQCMKATTICGAMSVIILLYGLTSLNTKYYLKVFKYFNILNYDRAGGVRYMVVAGLHGQQRVRSEPAADQL